ncbi:MAG: hypothetical protein ACM3SW_11765 [Actinomycetota bacterium]
MVLLLSSLAAAQSGSAGHRPGAGQHDKAAPAEDISGMYSFLRDGEFVQINMEENGVSGYISRQGDLDSDRGAFLDQFFDKASVEGHDVFFNTRPLHGVTFEFKGKFERGAARSKVQDGYYILRGTLTELITDGNNKTTSRSREVTFKLLGQPPDNEAGKDKD